MVRILPVLVWLAVSSSAWAQTGPPAPPPTMPPVRVEGERVPGERLMTPERAREEIERTPGGVGVVEQPAIEESRAANLKTPSSGCRA